MSCGYYFILRMKIFFIIKVRTIFLTVNNFISIKINLAKVPSFIHFRLIFESDLKSKIIRSYNAFLANSPQIIVGNNLLGRPFSQQLLFHRQRELRTRFTIV